MQTVQNGVPAIVATRGVSLFTMLIVIGEKAIMQTRTPAVMM
jgi:hypothetical protein